MIYADTDFFLALLKPSDWLKMSAEALYKKHKGNLWMSPATLTELLLLAAKLDLDPETLVLSALEIAELRGGQPGTFVLAAHYIKTKAARVFDALHAGFCGKDSQIISSDEIFDKLGLKRIPLGEERQRRAA